MAQITKKQEENLLTAIGLWMGVKPEQVAYGLNTWRCGTQACFGGWVARWEFFQKQGVEVDCGAPSVPPIYDTDDVSQLLFGDRSLFWMRKGWEGQNIFGEAVLSDHDVVLQRLCDVLAEAEVVEG